LLLYNQKFGKAAITSGPRFTLHHLASWAREEEYMPELPEVETVCRDLRTGGVIGEKIIDVLVLWEKSIADLHPDQFRAGLVNNTIISVTRRGKYIHLVLHTGTSLLIHLRMTGSLTLRDIHQTNDLHDRVIIQFTNYNLVFHDPRKFGRMILTNNPELWLDALGPEPLHDDFTAAVLYERLHHRKARLKTLLLDQKFIAGIGNIYADETLFLAKIHPCRTGESLSKEEAFALHRAIQHTLRSAITNRGTSLGTGDGNFTSKGEAGQHGRQLQVFRRTQTPCYICQTPIEKIIINQRSTHFCPHCQK